MICINKMFLQTMTGRSREHSTTDVCPVTITFWLWLITYYCLIKYRNEAVHRHRPITLEWIWYFACVITTLKRISCQMRNEKIQNKRKPLVTSIVLSLIVLLLIAMGIYLWHIRYEFKKSDVEIALCKPGNL